MVTKKVNFRGSTLADRLGTLNNFICNDEDNLKWNPVTDTLTQGIGENRFRISESIAPIWGKISVRYSKIAVYGTHDGTIEVYGLDNLGIETLLYQTKLNLTEDGTFHSKHIDMLKSACTSAITSMDNEHTLKNNIEIRMPKLRTKYDDVSLQSAWYDSSWSHRKGIPVNLPVRALHAKVLYTDDTGKDAGIKPIKAYEDDYWYETVYVSYAAEMQADFGDLRFTGFDGVSLIDHWIINKTDSNNATVMLRIPWYYGYYEQDRPEHLTNYGVNGGTAETNEIFKYSNLVKYLWMYYGNSSAADGSTTPTAGSSGIYYFDDFTTDTTSEWTTTGAAGAHSTFTWDASSSIDMQIDANNLDDGFFVSHALPSDISGTYASFDVIWKLENIPTTAGNYDGAVWVGSPGSGTTQPTNLLGLWISSTDVFAVQVDGGAVTSWTAGNLSYNHDDTEPLYIRARIHPTHETPGYAGITWDISKDCRKWTQVVHLAYSGDITVIPYSELTHFGMRISSWAAAPAFDMELDTDWIMITESHNAPARGNEFDDHFEFSDFQYQWTGTNYDGGVNTYTNDYSNSEADFAIISGSQRYYGGVDEAAKLEVQSFNASFDSTIVEARVDTHTRSGGTDTRAHLYVGSDYNNHFNIVHQLSSNADSNDVIYCWTTYGGSDYEKSHQKYSKEPISEGAVWLRIVFDKTTNRIIGQYSRDGYNWYHSGSDLYSSFSGIATDFGILLSNTGSGNGTCSFDYVRTTVGAYLANYGETFTAAQAYTDYDDIAPESTIYYGYTDDFEDNDLSGARTYPYREMTSFAGTLAVESAAPITGTYSAKHTGSGSATSTNIVQFEDPLIEYTATFNFKLSTQGVVAETPYVRFWVLRGANDGDSYTVIDSIYDGANQTLRVVNYHRRSGALLTSANWLIGSKLGTGTTYAFTIIDSGTRVTVKIDGTTYIDNYSYSGGTNVSKVLPGKYKGYGCNADTAGRWDDLVITPGYWYSSTQYTSPALTTEVSNTEGNWQTIYDPENSYYFKMPSSYVRNQPMILAWQEQGQSTGWQYSKTFYANTGGTFYSGPNGLDKYIGMKTKIIFEGDDDDTFEVTDISYEYEV